MVFQNVSPQMTIQLAAMDQKLTDLNKVINGDNLRPRYEGVSPPSIKTRIDEIVGALWTTTSAPSQTFIKSYKLAEGQVENLLKELKSISTSIEGIEKELEAKQVPYTPGRMPVGKKN